MSRSAFALRLDRALDEDAVRLFRGTVTHARRALADPTDTGVHSARKALKRARAVLRLVRRCVPPARYLALDQALRAAGRQMGPVRDAVVALDLTARLAAAGDLAPAPAARLTASLGAWRADARATLDPEALRADLDGLRLRPDDVAGLSPALVADGLAETYARATERLGRVEREPCAATLHAWRRQVKHYGYQLRLLVPVWPVVLRARARAVDDLASALGDDHDLAELDRHAASAGLAPRDRRAVRALVEAGRAETGADAWHVGVRVFADDPAAVAARTATLVTVALAEARDPALAQFGRRPLADRLMADGRSQFERFSFLPAVGA